MKNEIRILLLGLISMVGLSACHKCTEPIYTPVFSAVTQSYFSCYKQGSYFIYLNQDSSKRDSFYITIYIDTTTLDSKNCVKIRDWQCIINSNYIHQGTNYPFNMSIGFEPPISTNAIGGTSFGDPPVRIFGMSVLPGSDTFSRYNGQKFTGSSVKKISPFQLWDNKVLPEVTQYKQSPYGDIFFAPGVGIAEFITNDQKDTFRLTKYYIP